MDYIANKYGALTTYPVPSGAPVRVIKAVNIGAYPHTYYKNHCPLKKKKKRVLLSLLSV